MSKQGSSLTHVLGEGWERNTGRECGTQDPSLGHTYTLDDIATTHQSTAATAVLCNGGAGGKDGQVKTVQAR